MKLELNCPVISEKMSENVDRGIGILIAHLWAFGSGELKKMGIKLWIFSFSLILRFVLGFIVMVLLSTSNTCFGCEIRFYFFITPSYLKAWALSFTWLQTHKTDFLVKKAQTDHLWYNSPIYKIIRKLTSVLRESYICTEVWRFCNTQGTRVWGRYHNMRLNLPVSWEIVIFVLRSGGSVTHREPVSWGGTTTWDWTYQCPERVLYLYWGLEVL